jgi:hypothetical protein
VSREAHERVFRPLRAWLLEQQVPHRPEAAIEKVD